MAMAGSNSPIIIYSGGIPIAPADLDFGGSVTKTQINALSSFSQMVNAIPAEGNTWVPTGSETWDIYQLVLTMAQFAETAQGVVPSAASFATRQVAVAESNAKIDVVEPIPQATVDTPSSLAALNESISPLLEQAGFQFNRSPLLEQAGFQVNSSRRAPIPFDRTTSPAVSPTLSGTQPTGLAAMFLKLQAHLVTATQTDTLGNAFYPTPLYPANFYQPQYDSSWKPFTITPGQGDSWLPVSNGSAVTGEMTTIPLQRAWWSTWIFANRGWEFTPSSGMGQLSDGGNPPQGLMPMYASAVIFARNIKVSSQQETLTPTAAAASFTSRHAGAAQAAQTAARALAPQSEDDPSSMLIIGFVCTPLTQCPNPDPTLNWGS
jgi:hypothetical protein